MFYSILKLAHLLAIVLWVGGMIFAHCFLRPSLGALEAPHRLRLMQDVLGRFFSAVLGAVIVVLASGAWMIGRTARQVAETGGSFQMPHAWITMAILGVVMAAIFGHIRFALYPRLDRAVQAAQWSDGANAMAAIRKWVTVNLALGVLTIAVIMLG
ncbi:CopD family protein [Bordetella sp. 15P40C-2]|uniref:CopD family protein n=1 Tax=Bordetella sp. 15P40C-2 TaxID=2572246 RepID=UPI001323A5CF|nr:CopD family protein [Bordetella sp. 15P40C-2]MVW70898.1 hypothetical protein [Bordetella sp. 15P40C-2]